MSEERFLARSQSLGFKKSWLLGRSLRKTQNTKQKTGNKIQEIFHLTVHKKQEISLT